MFIQQFSSQKVQAQAAVAYADPCGDVAVIESLDDQIFPAEAREYEAFVETLRPAKMNLTFLPRMQEDLEVHVRTISGEWLSGQAFVAGLAGHDQAIADLTKAIDLKPGFVEAHLLRGIEYDNKKLYDQALADLTKVID